MSKKASDPQPEPAATPAAVASSARCGHFGACGGCQYQDIAYERQLADKGRALTDLFAPLGWPEPVTVAPSPDIWYYRNKMEFSFQDVYPAPPLGQDYLLLGLKRKKRWDKVLNLDECHLLSPEAAGLVSAVHQWALKEDLEPYNLHKQVGFLRHLVVREAKNGADRMVLLMTGPGRLPKESFVKTVLGAYPASTVLWGINTKLADVAKGEKIELLHGPGWITETALKRRFRVSPHTFFQTNTKGAEKLYARIREWVQELKPQNLLDLYCGSGGIILCCADLCERAMGIESVPSAVEDARHNASANEVKNSEFMEASVEEILPALASRGVDANVVIVDPPRSGLHPTAVKALGEMSPPWIIYVSCNPKAMAADIARLANTYQVKRLEAFDLFPHTEHVEALALLKGLF